MVAPFDARVLPWGRSEANDDGHHQDEAAPQVNSDYVAPLSLNQRIEVQLWGPARASISRFYGISGVASLCKLVSRLIQLGRGLGRCCIDSRRGPCRFDGS